MEEAQQDEISRLKETMEKELATLRLDFEATMKELEQKYETRLDELRDDLELRRKVCTGQSMLCSVFGRKMRQRACHCRALDVRAVLACDLVCAQMEIHEIEERKNLHINKLISNHEKAYREIKEYYFDITKDNLDLIKSLNVRSLAVQLL